MHVTHEMRNAYKIVYERSEVKRPKHSMVYDVTVNLKKGLFEVVLD